MSNDIFNAIYRAHVGGLGATYPIVDGDGTYTITGLPIDLTQPTDNDGVLYPGCSASQGAALLVIYEIPGAAEREISVYDGAVMLRPSSFSSFGGQGSKTIFHDLGDPIFTKTPKVAFVAGDTQQTTLSFRAEAIFNIDTIGQFTPTEGDLLGILESSSLSQDAQVFSNEATVDAAQPNGDCVDWFLFAMSTGDPHFSGFEGEHFEFQGEPDKFYNLISDTDLQVNAFFRRWATSPEGFTATQEIGVKSRSNEKTNFVRINADSTFEVNGKSFDNQIKLIKLEAVEVKRIYNVEEEQEFTKSEGFGTFMEGYEIITKGYRLLVIICTDGVNPPFINFKAEIRDTNVRPHGVIGQTADFDGKPRIGTGHHGEGVIEGVYQDYEINSLWSDNFKYNKYETPIH